MRTLDETRRRWAVSHGDGGDLAALQRSVKFDGPSSPCEAGCRSVCWKVFLLFRDTPAADHTVVMREAREDYDDLRRRYMHYIDHPELLAELTVDPLADDPESPWDAFRQDEMIRAEILQDVLRLPDTPLYHQENIQSLILDVLFIFCKQNPSVGGYRQGMHELVAPLVYVLSEDAIPAATLSSGARESADAGMTEMLDERYIEHDTYALFSKIMDRAKTFYEMHSPTAGLAVKNRVPSRELLLSLAADTPATAPEESTIVELSKEIHEGTLMKIDPELAVHLKNIEILPQIFLIRWIRLLFGREFAFTQHLLLWDSLFAFDPKLHLVPLICVAMLLRIRWQLLEADYSMALQSLLKYPEPQPPHGPHTFVDDAVFLRDHLDVAGGASLTLKYTGRSPAPVSPSPGGSHGSASRPLTPAATFAAGLGSLRSRTLKAATRSPLRSAWPGSAPDEGSAATRPGEATSPPSSRFVQSRENMGALFQGAAKGVLERGEKLGINRAVRDAVGEIKRNMAQSFEEAKHVTGRAPGSAGRPDLFSPTSSGKRLSYGQAMRIITASELRNKQLAKTLDEVVATLKQVASSSSKGDPLHDEEEDLDQAAQRHQQQQRHFLDAVELAAAKVQFVKVYLEDSSLTLPSDDATMASEHAPAGDSPPTAISHAQEESLPTPPDLKAGVSSAARAPASPKTPLTQAAAVDVDVGPLSALDGGLNDAAVDRMDVDENTPTGRRNSMNASMSSATASASAPTSDPLSAAVADAPSPPPPASEQQPHTIPTRSTLAQSSFAWMLEPGDTAASVSSSGLGSSPASSSAPYKKPASRPSLAGRTRHAFLFGEVVSQSPLGGDGNGGSGSSGDPLTDAQSKGLDGRSRSITSEEIFGLEPLRRALPRKE